MDIKQLAARYLEVRSNRDEKRRYIDYDMSNHLKALEKNLGNVEGNLRVLNFKNEINNEEELFEQLTFELQEIVEELKPQLIAVNAHRTDPLVVHVHDRTHFDVWLDENQEIQSAGLYTKVN